MNAEHACVHVIVEGRVQGVGFRNFVLEHALRLHLTGWVRNLKDDQVEIWAEGTSRAVDQLVAHVRTGPRAAFVSGITVEPETPRGSYTRFQVVASSWF